jgi:hypothetical protein
MPTLLDWIDADKLNLSLLCVNSNAIDKFKDIHWQNLCCNVNPRADVDIDSLNRNPEAISILESLHGNERHFRHLRGLLRNPNPNSMGMIEPYYSILKFPINHYGILLLDQNENAIPFLEKNRDLIDWKYISLNIANADQCKYKVPKTRLIDEYYWLDLHKGGGNIQIQ